MGRRPHRQRAEQPNHAQAANPRANEGAYGTAIFQVRASSRGVDCAWRLRGHDGLRDRRSERRRTELGQDYKTALHKYLLPRGWTLEDHRSSGNDHFRGIAPRPNGHELSRTEPVPILSILLILHSW